jgi:hypothetical protein
MTWNRIFLRSFLRPEHSMLYHLIGLLKPTFDIHTFGIHFSVIDYSTSYSERQS